MPARPLSPTPPAAFPASSPTATFAGICWTTRNLLSRPATEAMTPNPGVVTADLLATEGLRRLDDFHPLPGQKAGEAPVVDAEGQPIGMLMLKDLVKAGIV